MFIILCGWRGNDYYIVGAGNKIIRRKHKNIILDGLSTSEEHGGKGPPHDEDFLFVRLEEIVLATNSFSEACKIGHGGFGKVYEVTRSIIFYIVHCNINIIKWFMNLGFIFKLSREC